jgi:RNA polymerase sigma factor (sigma-70 family)
MIAKPCLRPIVGYLHELANRSAPSEASDRLLLERFAHDRDEDAFRALVQRHGALVYGVCRRGLRRHQDAEDCFQATFLVLARKAGSVRWHESVAGWLHQAATRLAADIRCRNARQRRREQAAALAQPNAHDDGTTTRELGAMLDEELGRLPERCRLVLVLCYLEGHTREQAAQRLGLT